MLLHLAYLLGKGASKLSVLQNNALIKGAMDLTHTDTHTHPF